MKTPAIDYLGKDYESFRQQMLSALESQVPGWQERSPADLGLALVEVLAYSADYLSYQQDAVATEAYLETARRRVSLRRHARSLGESISEGHNARVWVAFEVDQPVALPKATRLLTRTAESCPVLRPGSEELAQALSGKSRIFETMMSLELWPHLNQISFSTATPETALEATRAHLAGDLRGLHRGSVLVFEVPGETSGDSSAHAVRLSEEPRSLPCKGGTVLEVRWSRDDALPSSVLDRHRFPLEKLRVLGNVVLADDGRTLEAELPPVRVGEDYRPVLETEELTRRQALVETWTSATEALVQSGLRALPAMGLEEFGFEASAGPHGSPGLRWSPAHDLFSSGPFTPRFVVEKEADDRVRLRFGDGIFGRKPRPGSRFQAIYRVGNGPGGNIGPRALQHVVTDLDGIRRVWNPAPAQGGTPAEDNELIRRRVPFAFRHPRSCVASEDYVARLRSLPGIRAVQVARRGASTGASGRSQARLRIQTTEDRTLSKNFRRRIERTLEPCLLLGTSLQVLPPVWVGLDLVFRVRSAPGVLPEALLQTLDRSFEEFFGGSPYSFGETVQLEPLLERARRVAGVAGVAAETFELVGQPQGGGLATGRLEVRAEEIATVRNEKVRPDLGSFQFRVEVSHGL